MKKNIAFVLIVCLILLFFIIIKDNSKKEIVVQVKEPIPEVVVKPEQVINPRVKLQIVDVKKDIKPIKEVVVPIDDEFPLPDLGSTESIEDEVKEEIIVLKESNDYLPPVPDELEEIESSEKYLYEGRIISKREYLQLNINEEKPADMYSNKDDYSYDNIDATLSDLAPEPVKIKKVVKKRASNTPDLKDLFN